MDRFKYFLIEARYTQWVKNLLIFLPIFFGGKFLQLDLLLNVLFTFLTFCFLASIVYVINDINDLDEDKKHSNKKNRPLASGKVTRKEAFGIIIIFSFLTILFVSLSYSLELLIIYFLYLIFNLFYTFGLKRIAYMEMLVVASFYLMRLEAGGFASDIGVSFWLNAVIFFGALLFIIGKRYTEKRFSNSRSVLKQYSEKNLNSLILATSIATAFFMFAYSFVQGPSYLPLAILFSLALMRYIRIVKTTNKGESAKIFLDKILISLIFLLVTYSGIIIYL